MKGFATAIPTVERGCDEGVVEHGGRCELNVISWIDAPLFLL